MTLYILTRSPAFVKLYSVVFSTVGTTTVVRSVDHLLVAYVVPR
jgi:hypothetical protein